MSTFSQPIFNSEIQEDAIKGIEKLSSSPLDYSLLGKASLQSMRVMCLYFKKEVPYFDSLAESLLRFTPWVAIRDREAIYLEISGSLQSLSEKSLNVRVLSLCKRFGIAPRIGVAHDAPSALAITKHGKYDTRNLPIDAIDYFASPFSNEHSMQSEVSRLKRGLDLIGVQTLGDFCDLDKETLSLRFGKLANVLCEAIQNSYRESWPLYVPAPIIQEGISTRDPDLHRGCKDRDTLKIFTHRLLDRISARMKGRFDRISKLEIRYILEASSEVKEREQIFLMEFPYRHGSTNALMDEVETQILKSSHEFNSPVVRIEMEVLETKADQILTYKSWHNMLEGTKPLKEGLVLGFRSNKKLPVPLKKNATQSTNGLHFLSGFLEGSAPQYPSLMKLPVRSLRV